MSSTPKKLIIHANGQFGAVEQARSPKIALEARKGVLLHNNTYRGGLIRAHTHTFTISTYNFALTNHQPQVAFYRVNKNTLILIDKVRYRLP